MSIWLDVTTSFEWGRQMVGIVRVEAETARAFLNSDRSELRFCRFDRMSGSYIEVSSEDVSSTLKRLEVGGEVIEIQDGLSSSCILERMKHPFDIDDCYISLGLDWDQKDMEVIYKLKKKVGLKVILCCYDMIPILFPQYCVSGVPEKFPKYFVDASWCANKILCISECSKHDLTYFLNSVGAPVPHVDVIRLGCDFFADRNNIPSDCVDKLSKRPFILYVSTIEPRKNHSILYRAYRYIVENYKVELPLIVFVGMQGWGVDDLMQDIRNDKQVGHYFQVLDHVSDHDLAYLYRNSIFTVYPSHYEGWGLPVAESLAYGKFCLASNAASIPEVGGELVEYIDPSDEEAWAKRLLWYFQNPDFVKDRELEISHRYRRKSWKETVEDIVGFVDDLA